jgi:hypothetical protein
VLVIHCMAVSLGHFAEVDGEDAAARLPDARHKLALDENRSDEPVEVRGDDDVRLAMLDHLKRGGESGALGERLAAGHVQLLEDLEELRSVAFAGGYDPVALLVRAGERFAFAAPDLADPDDPDCASHVLRRLPDVFTWSDGGNSGRPELSGRRYTDADRAQARKMRAAGASYEQIIAALGVSKGTLSYWLNPGSRATGPRRSERFTPEAVERREWARTLARDPCAYCGAPAPAGTVDHIVASARGGDDTVENLTGACRRCNGGKSARPLLWFLLDEATAVRDWRRAA